MVLYLILFLKEVYPAVNNLFNLDYSSAINRIIISISFLIVVAVFIHDILKKKHLSRKLIGIIIVISLIFTSAFLTISLNSLSIDAYTKTNYLTIILRSIPAIFLAAILVSRKKEWHLKQLSLLAFLFSISFLKYLFFNISSMFLGQSLRFGGVNYNDFAYICTLNIAFCYLLIFEAILSRSKRKWQVIVYVTYLIISYTALFLSGGRGALMVSIILLFVFILLLMRKLKFDIKRISITFAAVLSLLFITSNIISNNEALQMGVERGFSFLDSSDSTGVINWDETSGRSDIYQQSLELINEQPFLGYGISSVFLIHPTSNFSHNIFLDILIDGGILYLSICLFILFYLIFKSIKNMEGFDYYFPLSLFIFSFVNLLSGSNYLIEPIFWFSIVYIFLLQKQEKLN